MGYIGTPKGITDTDTAKHGSLISFLSFRLLLFCPLLHVRVIAPLCHGHAILEVIRDVCLPLIPSLQAVATESTCPTLDYSLGSLLPSCLDDVVKGGIVEVLYVLAQMVRSVESPICHISPRAFIDPMILQEVIFRRILGHAKCADSPRVGPICQGQAWTV